ncbi:MAG: DUF1844 domain-containing protein [Planctomycetes bacterium]|nr:DUF1844 domain-containing protein [Planctomycetota bacterium]
MAEDEKKIIVDDDWKAQAKAEKEKLAKQAESPGNKPAAGPAGPAGKPGSGAQPAAGAEEPRQLPPASFNTLVSSLVTQVFMALGGYEDPRTKKRYVDLDLAKHYIDTLVVLEQKTKGNLTDEEKKLLDQVIYESRMQYVQLAQRAMQI